MSITKKELADKIQERYAGCGFAFVITGIANEESKYIHIEFTLSPKYALTAQADTDWEERTDSNRLMYGFTICNRTENPNWIRCNLDLLNDTEVLQFLSNWTTNHESEFEKMVVEHNALEKAIKFLENQQDELRRTYAKGIRKYKTEDESNPDDED